MSSNYFKAYPDANGFYEEYGGAFVPEILESEMKKIADAYHTISKSHNFISELRSIRKHYQGRPTPVYYCNRLSEKYGGRIYLKREDLNHTGAHKLNHCMGEALLAKHLGKKKLIAETGAGQHGVALATAAAYFGLECEIHMGEVDIAKEHPNVIRMEILGATVVPVTHGLKTLKEAVDSAFGAYLEDPINSIYCIGSVVGPHPFPMMVRDFQRVVGIEAKEQFFEMTGEQPDNLVACVGGGSNAMGIFSAFLDDDDCSIYGVEPGGRDINVVGEHAATITHGKPGIIHGFKCYTLQDEKGEPAPVHSVASGLDYPGVGPEHSMLHDWKRVDYTSVSDDECIEAFYELSRLEGIIPALESSHAVAHALKLAKEKPHESILINLSGRGDKDIDFIVENYGLPGEAPRGPRVQEKKNSEPLADSITTATEAAPKEEMMQVSDSLVVEELPVIESPKVVASEPVIEVPVVSKDEVLIKEEEVIVFDEVEEIKAPVDTISEEKEVIAEVSAVAEPDPTVEIEEVPALETKKADVPKAKPVSDVKEDTTAQVVADRFKAQPSVVGKHSQTITDIRKAISITDRFLYLRVLFNNDQELFNNALEAINASKSFDAALLYLGQFEWENSETSEQFVQMVSRRFS